MQKRCLHAGEKRHIRLLVHSTNDEAFYIRNARWELKNFSETEATGVCVVDEHQISCLIEPKKAQTTYKLRITYEIADEVLVEVVEIQVS